MKPDNIPEPNNLYPPEGCAVANFSEAQALLIYRAGARQLRGLR